MITDMPPGYTEKVAAQKLTEMGWKVSARTLRDWRKDEKIQHHWFGGRVRYTDEDLKAIIDGGLVCPEQIMSSNSTPSRSSRQSPQSASPTIPSSAPTVPGSPSAKLPAPGTGTPSGPAPSDGSGKAYVAEILNRLSTPSTNG
jgi:hypothetical protein